MFIHHAYHPSIFSHCIIHVFISACTGLHHLHWLQHFVTVLACLHHILLNIEVSLKLYNIDYTFAYDHLAQVYAMYFSRKELIERLHNFVHLNFCIALSLGLFFFLTGIHTATTNIVRYMYVCNCHLLYYFNILKVAKNVVLSQVQQTKND